MIITFMIHTLFTLLSMLPISIARPVADVLPPCATEDSVGCYWDASTSGTPGEPGYGTGRSFIVDTDGTVRYL